MARCSNEVLNLRIQQIQFILDNITEPDYLQLDNCALDTAFDMENSNKGFCPARFYLHDLEHAYDYTNEECQ